MDNLTEFEQYLVTYMDWDAEEGGWNDSLSNMEAVWDYQQGRIAELKAENKRLAEFNLKYRDENQRLREALEVVAGRRQCVDNTMPNTAIAEAALQVKEEVRHER